MAIVAACVIAQQTLWHPEAAWNLAPVGPLQGAAAGATSGFAQYTSRLTSAYASKSPAGHRQGSRATTAWPSIGPGRMFPGSERPGTSFSAVLVPDERVPSKDNDGDQHDQTGS